MNTSETTARGTALLIGRDGPFEPEEGARLIASAVEQGDAQAMAVMATLKGAGAWTAQSWPEALRASPARGRGRRGRRTRAAHSSRGRSGAGGRGARGQGGRRTLGGACARASISRNGSCRRRRSRSATGRKIWIAENFATPELCAWLVEPRRRQVPALDDVRRPEGAVPGHAQPAAISRSPSSTAAWCCSCCASASACSQTSSPAQMEPPQIFHYALGQDIKPHYDSLYDERAPLRPRGHLPGRPAGDVPDVPERRL